METTRAHVVVVVVAVLGGALLAVASGPRAGSAFADDVVARDAFAEDPGRAWLDGRKLDLNRADAKSLARISGIGPALAQRIVDERAHRGRFDDVNDLDDVDGIGPKLLEKLSAFVEVR